MEFSGVVHAVGVLASGEDAPLLLLCSAVKKRPLQFFATRLDAWTSALCSPFYEHTVKLAEVEAAATEEQALLVFCLQEWSASQFRIPASVRDEQEYARLARDIVRHSFYVLLVAPRDLPAWQRDCFNWDTRRQWGLGFEYVREFSVREWLAREATPAQYWLAFTQRFARETAAAVKSLALTGQASVAHDCARLYQVLDAWPCRACAGYFKYRLLDVPLARRVSARDLRAVAPGALSLARLRDLDLLCAWLESGEEAPAFGDLGALLALTVGPQALQAVLTRYERRSDEQRARVTRHLVVGWIARETERAARASLSTVYPLTVKSALYYYRRLFGLSAPQAPPVLVAEEEEAQHAHLQYDESHCGEVVRALGALVAPLWHSLQGDALGYWAVKSPAAYAAEDALRAHFTQAHCLLEGVSDCADWDAVGAQRAFDALDDVDARLYDVRVTALLCAPDALLDGADLAALHAVMREAIFTCVVVRPGDHTLRRVERAFAATTDITLADVRARLFGVRDLGRAPARETVVALDCHLWAVEALLALLQWVHAQRATVRRLVMLGCDDALPLHADGQAWLDALGWLGWRAPAWYARLPLMDAQLARVVARATHLVALPAWPGAPLQGEQTLLAALVRARRPAGLRLYCVARDERAGRALLQAVEAGMSPKFRLNNRVVLRSVTLAQLVQLARGAQDAHCFFVAQAYARTLDRNAVQHLLLTTADAPLVVRLDAQPGQDGFKWLRKSRAARAAVPNARYTRRYLALRQ